MVCFFRSFAAVPHSSPVSLSLSPISLACKYFLSYTPSPYTLVRSLAWSYHCRQVATDADAQERKTQAAYEAEQKVQGGGRFIVSQVLPSVLRWLIFPLLRVSLLAVLHCSVSVRTSRCLHCCCTDCPLLLFTAFSFVAHFLQCVFRTLGF